MIDFVSFVYKETATTEIYTYFHTLSLHDALPIWSCCCRRRWRGSASHQRQYRRFRRRSEAHTSELQSLMRISYAIFCLKKKSKTSICQRVHGKSFHQRAREQVLSH